LAATDLLVGTSLDGDVDDFNGVVEVKCPKSATHLGYLRGGDVPRAYVPQIMHNLWVTGAAWCDFVSFDDRFPPELSLFVVRFVAGDMKSYEEAARTFLAEVDQEVASVEAYRAARTAA
jgi:hypothetical protein